MIAAIMLLQVALGVHQGYWRSAALRIVLSALVSAGAIALLYLVGGVGSAPALTRGLVGALLIIACSYDITRIVGALGLILLLAVTLFAETAWTGDSMLADQSVRLADRSVSLPVLVAGFAALLLLGRPINDLCRSVLHRMRQSDDQTGEAAPPPRSRRGWRLMIGGRSLAALQQDDVHEVMQLRGGRFIGPLERWLILLLTVTGQPTLIAALVAAKGIGRFPELSADRARGAKAEEFLVGSLVSWGCAGLAGLLLLILPGA